jgi:AMP-polyphosphate phosphotransferase
MKRITSLSSLLKNKTLFESCILEEDDLKDLQHKMLRIQQAAFQKKERIVILFEGFDAAGKGGTIRKLTEGLDPRSVRVHPIGPPTEMEQGTHWLFRFWTNLPSPGTIAIFDRSWYGRVLVERVDKLISKKQIELAFDEINQFEKILYQDGVRIIKIFLAITKDEQYGRFQDRLNDPYKQWKLSMADIKARKQWDEYVKAVDQILKKSNPKFAPWVVIPANSKKFARKATLMAITKELSDLTHWMEKKAKTYAPEKLSKLLKR